MTTVIDAHGVTKRFGSVTAVDDVSFTVEENRIYGLLGRNGAGKTTLMQLLTGQLFATHGEIELFGASPVENAKVLSPALLHQGEPEVPGRLQGQARVPQRAVVLRRSGIRTSPTG